MLGGQHGAKVNLLRIRPSLYRVRRGASRPPIITIILTIIITIIIITIIVTVYPPSYRCSCVVSRPDLNSYDLDDPT